MDRHVNAETVNKGQSHAEVEEGKCALVVDGVTLNGPTLDMQAAEAFLAEAMPIIMEEAVRKATDVREKVCEWRSPEQLKELLDLELRERGEAKSKILQRCRDAIRYSAKTGHPRFFNQLYAGMDPYSLVGRFLTEAINPSLYTYEVAPVFILTEEAVLTKMFEIIGWKEGGDGIFSPGGSVSNMYAVNVARYHHCPDVKELGLSAMPRLVMFTSQESHYSVAKAAAFLGIGTKNVYMIPSDKRGKMISVELEKQVKRAKDEGALPFMVNATSGTTVLGAFDPLEEIADICERHQLWLHVDACWGGGALVSKKHRNLLRGIQRANSVAWNPHKMLMAGPPRAAGAPGGAPRPPGQHGRLPWPAPASPGREEGRRALPASAGGGRGQDQRPRAEERLLRPPPGREGQPLQGGLPPHHRAQGRRQRVHVRREHAPPPGSQPGLSDALLHARRRGCR